VNRSRWQDDKLCFIRCYSSCSTNIYIVSGTFNPLSINVEIGTTTPQAKLEVNGAIRLTPSATPTNPVEGMMYYDKNERTFKCYVGSGQTSRWVNCGGEPQRPEAPLTVPFVLYDSNNNKVLEINVE